MTTETRLLSLGELMDTAVRLARSCFGAVYPGIALPLTAAAGVMVVLQIGFFRSFFPGMASMAADPVGIFKQALPFVVGLVVYLSVYAMAAVALLSCAVDVVTDRPVSVARGWLLTLRPRVAWTGLVWLAVVLAGTLLCIVPGIWAALVLAMTLPVMIAEERHGWDAVARSYELMRHNPSHRFTHHPVVRLLILAFAGGAVSYAANLAVSLPFVVAQQVLMFRTVLTSPGNQPGDPQAMFTSSWVWLQLPQTVLSTLVTTAVSLFTSLATALLYRDLVNSREGRDLEAMLDELGAPRLPTEPAPGA
jgi:hypothetical protein